MRQADDEPIMDPARRRKADTAVFHPRPRGPATVASPQMLLIQALFGEMCPAAASRVAGSLSERSQGYSLEALNARAAFDILGMV